MKDLRQFIGECEKRLPREFVRISKEVDPKFEITAIVKKFDLMGKHPLLFFEKGRGSHSPVVCNTTTRRRSRLRKPPFCKRLKISSEAPATEISSSCSSVPDLR